MRKLIIAVLALLVGVLFLFQGAHRIFPVPVVDDDGILSISDDGISRALDEIYYNVTIMGIGEATPRSLEKDFGISPGLFSEVYGRYTDGRFGIADVLIVKPAEKKEAEAREALITVRTARTSLFKNYDIYDSSRIAENGVICTHGEYLILLMIKNTAEAREILDEYLPS